ncbi:unnamed protein product, partial [Symbiodinium pilosum]
ELSVLSPLPEELQDGGLRCPLERLVKLLVAMVVGTFCGPSSSQSIWPCTPLRMEEQTSMRTCYGALTPRTEQGEFASRRRRRCALV